MDDQVIITKGLHKGMVGRYLGKAFDEGKVWLRIEMEYTYEVLFEESEVEFLNKKN